MEEAKGAIGILAEQQEQICSDLKWDRQAYLLELVEQYPGSTVHELHYVALGEETHISEKDIEAELSILGIDGAVAAYARRGQNTYFPNHEKSGNRGRKKELSYFDAAFLDAVQEHPGNIFSDLVVLAGLPRSQLRISGLEEGGRIVCHGRHLNAKKIYPRTSNPEEMKAFEIDAYHGKRTADAYRIIAANPAIRFPDFRNALGVIASSASWHLRKLVDAGHVVSKKDRILYLFTEEFYARNRGIIPGLLLGDKKSKLLAELRKSPGNTRQGLGKALGVTNVDWHLSALEKRGLVHRIKKAGVLRFYAVPSHSIDMQVKPAVSEVDSRVEGYVTEALGTQIVA